MSATPQWLFGPFRLDMATIRLWDGETPVALSPKAFDVLHYLVTHPERLLTKGELLEAVWPATTVTDAVVRVAIGAVRKALGETAQAPRYIATVPRRGYRFLAPVTQVGPSAPVVSPVCAIPSPIEALRVDPPPSLDDAQEPLSLATLDGERKQVTVLVAEIPEILVLLRAHDAEVVQQRVEPALQAMMDAVRRYDGRVHQVRGTGILALFGAPLAHEDHALRACYAALAMQTALRGYVDDMQRRHGWTLQGRIGLHAGEVVIRAFGNERLREPSLLGPTTALAERLQQWAPPGTIVLSATTARLVEAVTRVTAVGRVALAPLAAPMQVYALHGARGRPGRLHTARARGLTPFVGRQVELAALHRVLPQAAAGHGQLVAIVGEAGVGKSRLVDEVLQRAAAEGWRVLDSAAVSYGQATPYFPVLDLLRRYWHLEEGAAPATIAAQVTAQVVRLDTALQDTVPALLALLDALPGTHPFLSLDPPQRRQHTFTALKRLLVRASQVQPLGLLVEDLHWLDTETQALLESLVESLPTARLLLLVTYRPEYQHGWGSKTYYTHVRLNPLPAASADTFLQALLGHDPSVAALKALLIPRTEGNPFFLEESVRTLVETGTLVGEQGAYRVVHACPTWQMPATVQAVLAARIDRLPLAAKQVLQTAAALGTEIPMLLLQGLVEMPEAVVQRALAHLQAAEFLYETCLFPERVYTFKHALTQEVAYHSMLHTRRRALHARLVAAVEALAGDRTAEQVERLAHHALHSEVWEKALPYCRQAGEKALARSAYPEAVGYFAQALQALAQLPETRDTWAQAIDLRLTARTAHRALGDFTRLRAELREAEALAERLADPRRLAQVALYLSNHASLMGDHPQAIAAAQRALALATVDRDGVRQALAHLYLGAAYQAQSAYQQALDCFCQAVAAFDGAPPYDRCGQVLLPAVTARVRLAWCHAELGTFAAGRAVGEAGLRIAAAAAHPVSLMTAAREMGLLCLHQGDLASAIPLLEQAIRLCQDMALPTFLLQIGMGLSAAYMLGGRRDDGLALLMQALAQGRALDTIGSQALHGCAVGETQLMAGRLAEAHASAADALACARAHQEHGHEAYALRLLGEIAGQREPLEVVHAEAYYSEALALANALGLRPLQAHCHHGLGTLYAKAGQAVQARTELSTAIAMYQAMAMTFWLPETERALAQLDT